MSDYIHPLHIYGQQRWHDDAVIVGTKEALIQLRDALDQAIANKNGAARVTQTDGEGFDIIIMTSTAEQMEKHFTVYHDEQMVNRLIGHYPIYDLGLDKYRELKGLGPPNERQLAYYHANKPKELK